MKNVAVIGAGVMGAGIAEICAANGFTVSLIDLDEAILQKALERIKRHDEGLRIVTSTDIDMAKDADIIVEAVIEDPEIKKEIFATLDALNPLAILASNTSTIPIASIATSCKNKARVLGLHFYNPPHRNKLVEIVTTEETSEEVYEKTLRFAKELGKVPVRSKDVYGFIGNRILMPLINEAIWALHDGVATKEDIDTTFQTGMVHPMGPLALADFIGLDTCLFIMTQLYEGLSQDKFRPCPLLVELVEEGKLGKKNKEGFYLY